MLTINYLLVIDYEKQQGYRIALTEISKQMLPLTTQVKSTTVNHYLSYCKKHTGDQNANTQASNTLY